MKTSWGSSEKQLADGTLILTSPAGDTHVTIPGSAPPEDYCAERSAMMPTRRRTRTQDRAHRVAAERRQNHQARTAHQTAPADSRPPPDPNDDPPPF